MSSSRPPSSSRRRSPTTPSSTGSPSEWRPLPVTMRTTAPGRPRRQLSRNPSTRRSAASARIPCRSSSASTNAPYSVSGSSGGSGRVGRRLPIGLGARPRRGGHPASRHGLPRVGRRVRTSLRRRVQSEAAQDVPPGLGSPPGVGSVLLAGSPARLARSAPAAPPPSIVRRPRVVRAHRPARPSGRARSSSGRRWGGADGAAEVGRRAKDGPRRVRPPTRFLRRSAGPRMGRRVRMGLDTLRES